MRGFLSYLGIYVDMKTLIKTLVGKYLVEQKSWIDEHCDSAFLEAYDRKFCKVATKIFQKNKGYRNSVIEKMKLYIRTNIDEISDLNIEELQEESKIATEGFREFDWVVEQSGNICPKIEEKMTAVYNKLLDGEFVLFVHSNGNYHLLNRLDTNYSALAVMFTEYLEKLDIPYQLWLMKYNKQTLDEPIEHLIKTILYPHIYNLTDFEGGTLVNLFSGENHLESMIEETIIKQRPDFSSKVFRVLSKVRESGFENEKKFIDKLDENGIEYKNFAKDYGFVDRFLGIDLFIKEPDGNWYPAQVKSSKQEQNLIESLGCKGYIEVYWNGENFIVNNKEFDLYFCKQRGMCHKKEDEELF